MINEKLGKTHKIIKLPLLPSEVRGIEALKTFSENLIESTVDVHITKRKKTNAPEEAPKEAPKMAVPETVTPEMIAVVKSLLAQPGGIQKMLQHPKVIEARKNDADLGPFFRDIEAMGLFGGFPYLSNVPVMTKLSELAPFLLEK